MFNNCRIVSISLNYSYFREVYHNYDTFTLIIVLIILTFTVNKCFLPLEIRTLIFYEKFQYLQFFKIGVYVYHIWICLTIIRLRSDIEKNAGLKRDSNQVFSIFIGILIEFPFTTIINYSFCEIIFPSINSMQFFISETNLNSIIAFNSIQYKHLSIVNCIQQVLIFNL